MAHTRKRTPRFGKAFCFFRSPCGGHVAICNRVPRGQIGKSGAHVEFTYFHTGSFPFTWAGRPKKLSIVQPHVA